MPRDNRSGQQFFTLEIVGLIQLIFLSGLLGLAALIFFVFYRIESICPKLSKHDWFIEFFFDHLKSFFLEVNQL